MGPDITRIIQACQSGDAAAAEALLPAVYGELRRLASARLAGERPGQTLQATALVHEAYLRLLPGDESANPVRWDGRGHFFAAAAEAMRRILVERARAKSAGKRGGGWRRVALDPARLTLDEVPPELIELDDVLTRFREIEPRKAKLVELRFFAGLTLEQAAELLDISPATAGRDWAFARAWLYRALGPDTEKKPPPHE
jgi:RNA polymerase sigma factor (TIGR02999 family)